jgi:hypothetical protein
MPGQSIGEKPMTDVERQARYRAARAAGRPAIRICRPTDHRSRAQRCDDTIGTLVGLQAEYAAWLAALPANLRDSSLIPSFPSGHKRIRWLWGRFRKESYERRRRHILANSPRRL